jgi:adenine/guanine phosphoribosyltransferase-like PRPP-binding protein
VGFQSYAYYDGNSERVADSDNFIPSREYDRIITAKVQSDQYYHYKDIKRGKGLIADNSKIKKAKTIMVVDD